MNDSLLDDVARYLGYMVMLLTGILAVAMFEGLAHEWQLRNYRPRSRGEVIIFPRRYRYRSFADADIPIRPCDSADRDRVEREPAGTCGPSEG